jgi:hypothetical protein
MEYPAKELFTALSKAQGEFPPIPKNKKVDVYSKPPERKFLYSYMYADLTTIIDCTRPALSKNGLSFTQQMFDKGFVTVIMHSSGETIRTGFIPCEIKPDTDMKTVAGIVTYVKRISLTAALGVSADEDIDAEPDEAKLGNSTIKSDVKQRQQPRNYAPTPQQQAPVQSSPPVSSTATMADLFNEKPPMPPTGNLKYKGPSEAQIKRMFAIASKNSWPPGYVTAYVSSQTGKKPSELSRSEYDAACANFEATKFSEKLKNDYKDFLPFDIKSEFEKAKTVLAKLRSRASSGG